MADIQIREFQYPEDYDAALRLWDGAGPGVHVGPSDTPAELEKKLQRDPDLFLVALDGERLVGTVMGAFDGRRGMIYHLAVAQEYRRGGIASRLMAQVETRLNAKGCVKCYLLVRPDNDEAVHYYKRIGWSVSDNILFMKEFS
jgi:ribosomal protein S18 acetylase RimI-like enzyme